MESDDGQAGTICGLFATVTMCVVRISLAGQSGFPIFSFDGPLPFCCRVRVSSIVRFPSVCGVRGKTSSPLPCHCCQN